VPNEKIPNDSDTILRRLWMVVHSMLEQDKTLKPTDKAEFLQKVKNYPEEKFISKVKDKANAAQESVTSWGGLFSEGMYPTLFCLQCFNRFLYVDVFYSVRVPCARPRRIDVLSREGAAFRRLHVTTAVTM
jgi:hypothetical protein